LPRIKNRFVCSVCGSAGGSILTKAVRDTVYLPRFLEIHPDIMNGKDGFKIVNNIKTIPEALDFVAKIFLKVEEYFIRHPPSGDVGDEFADLVYAGLASYGGLHTKDEIKQFEERYKDNSTSRTSVAFRYGAILFTALSRMWRQIDFSEPILFEENVAFTICNIYYNGLSQFLDNRIKIPLLKWPELLSTATDISYRHAASEFGIWTESGKRSLSAKYIKNRKYEMLIRCFYYQLFEPGEKLYECFMLSLNDIKSDSDIKRLLMSEFDIQEKESDSRSFHRHNYYNMQHHLSNGKKKACRLDDGKMLQVEITDEIYSEHVHELIGIYTFVARLAESEEVDFNANPATMELKQYLVQRVKILVNECYERLLELNYRADFALQKVAADLLRLDRPKPDTQMQ